jgi:hypothetical protein
MEKHGNRTALGKGEYADHFDVGHNYVAFYLDCGQLTECGEQTAVYSRIITSPVGAYRLSVILGQALREYRRRFGSIRDEGGMTISEEKSNE